MENNRIVIDTNVVVSSGIGKGTPYKLFDEIIADAEFEICVSDAVLREYNTVPLRDKFRKDKFLSKFPDFEVQIKYVLALIEINSTHFTPTQTITKVKDDADNRFLELAVEAEALCIITGNTKDFDFEEYEEIKIFSPRDFYEWWEENQ